MADNAIITSAVIDTSNVTTATDVGRYTTTANSSLSIPIIHAGALVSTMANDTSTQPILTLANLRQAPPKKIRGRDFNSHEDSLLQQLAEEWWVGLHESSAKKWNTIFDEWNNRRRAKGRLSSTINERSSMQLSSRYNGHIKKLL